MAIAGYLKQAALTGIVLLTAWLVPMAASAATLVLDGREDGAVVQNNLGIGFQTGPGTYQIAELRAWVAMASPETYTYTVSLYAGLGSGTQPGGSPVAQSLNISLVGTDAGNDNFVDYSWTGAELGTIASYVLQPNTDYRLFWTGTGTNAGVYYTSGAFAPEATDLGWTAQGAYVAGTSSQQNRNPNIDVSVADASIPEPPAYAALLTAFGLLAYRRFRAGKALA